MNSSITSKESHWRPTKRAKSDTNKRGLARLAHLPSTPVNKTFSHSFSIFGCTGIKYDGEQQFLSFEPRAFF